MTKQTHFFESLHSEQHLYYFIVLYTETVTVTSMFAFIHQK